MSISMKAIAAKVTAFIYIRVSTPSQEVNEQLKMIQQYAADHGIEVIGQYGDYEKRHKTDQRRSFQAMLNDIETLKPSMILVQRLDRFGTKDGNELGFFITTLNKHGVKLVTAIDGKDRSKSDLETTLLNAIAASQSKQEQIDKAERLLTGKRAKALLGEYIGTKNLAYGFDVLCIGKDGKEKWRLVEDGQDVRIKYVLNKQGDYAEAERYGNETITDPNGIMPDKEIRHRPAKDSSDRLFYSPSIRQERVNTLRRICEWFDSGWTTYRIADQLNDEGVRPVHSDRWYSSLIDGLLENSVVIGKPSWNKTSQSNFRHLEGGKIVETSDDKKATYRQNDRQEWFQPFDEVFEPIIEPALFDRIQAKLEARRNSTSKRSPRSEQLWLGGLWWDADSGTKLAGNAQGKNFRVNHPDYRSRKLPFREAEAFIAEYLNRVGQRIEAFGEAVEDKKLIEKLATEEWMKELHLEYIVLEIGSYLEKKLGEGFHQVCGHEVIIDHNDDGSPLITTDADYLELYCEMVKDDMEQNQTAVQEKMADRKRLTLDLMKMKNKDQYIIDSYNERIGQLSQEIEAATAMPDYLSWWQEVQDELELLRRRQAQVGKAIEQGSFVQKTEAIRRLIERIDCHWTEVLTTDKRFPSGFKSVCDKVTIHSTAAAVDKDDNPIETMTIETPSRSNS